PPWQSLWLDCDSDTGVPPVLRPRSRAGRPCYHVGGAVRCRRGEYGLEAYATLGAGNVPGVPGRNKESFYGLLWPDCPRKTESALELLARYEPKSLFFVEHYCRRMFFACNDACPRIVPRPDRQGQVNRLERCSDCTDRRSEGAKDRRRM